jgi:ATP-binding cassette subfamily F protein 3
MSQQNKHILSCRNIDKTFDELTVLKDITFSLQSGEKIGLVGPNGTGKSTLLKIIAGILEQDAGVIERAKNISIGYIPQNFDSFNSLTVSEFLTNLGDGSDNRLQQLKLDKNILQRKISELSGGEKTKISVLRIMVLKYDLFLLDEPTNNLDVDALMVLEDFVQKSDKTFVIVSHDRLFLDRTVSKIIGINEFTKKAAIYDGNFSDYIKQKELQNDREWKTYDDMSEKRDKIENTVKEKMQKATSIGKSKARDNDKMAKNFKTEMGQRTMQRGARLLKDKLDNMEPIERPKTLRPLKVNFDIEERSGDKVLEMKNVYKKLPTKFLGPINLSVQYGDRILVVGKNGAGKSTILKMIIKHRFSDEGEIIIGTRVVTGYLKQEEDFPAETTVLEIMQQEIGVEESLARKTLNRFRINEEDISKKMSDLSSGERSRLMLALIMTKKPNLIILDEPSNHIDLEVLTELEKALIDFKGTLIVVSHDRYFIQKLNFNKVYVLEDTLKLIGNYQEYEIGL